MVSSNNIFIIYIYISTIIIYVKIFKKIYKILLNDNGLIIAVIVYYSLFIFTKKIIKFYHNKNLATTYTKIFFSLS